MSAKTHYTNAIARAFNFYHRRNNFCYLYGAKGQVATYDLIQSLFAAEPKHYAKYTMYEREEIIKNSIGKIAFDCSGFVNACFNWLPQNYSSGYYANKTTEYPDYRSSRTGCMLYTTFGGTGRHIGIDVGSGMFMHMGNESTNKNIALGIDSVRLEWFTGYPNYWEHFFEEKGVDYTGTTNEVIDNEYK